MVIRVLGLEEDGVEDREDAKARIHAAEAALARLEQLVDEDWVREHVGAGPRSLPVQDGSLPRPPRRRRRRRHRITLSQDYQRLVRELLDAERQALVDYAGTG